MSLSPVIVSPLHRTKTTPSEAPPSYDRHKADSPVFPPSYQESGAMHQGKGSPLQSLLERMGRKLQVVWDTAECEPARSGGLGVVSKSVPEALTRLVPGLSIATIVAYLKPMQREDEALKARNQADKAYQPTGLTLKLHIPDNGRGTEEHFEVLHRFEPLPEDADKPREQQRGVTKFAFKNKKYFDVENLYVYTESPKRSGAASKTIPLVDAEPSFTKNMIRTRLSALLMPYLNGSKPLPPGAALGSWKPENQLHAVVANDWMSGPLFRQMQALKDASFDPTKMFKAYYTHNNYDTGRPLDMAKRVGMVLPTEESLLHPADAMGGKHRVPFYSPLTLGMLDADRVIADRNYILTLTKTPFARGEAFRDILIAKAEAGLTSDMHHAPALRFNPRTNPDLLLDGFRQLGVDEASAVDFKAHNKGALQKTLGLKSDPDATVMTWMARCEPRQKGFNLLADSMLKALKDHPHLQLVIWGDVDKNDRLQVAYVEKLRQEIRKNPDLKERVFWPNEFAKGANEKRIAQSYAGSDFVILPSLKEPYGLTQLEAQAMAAIPVVHGSDGIRSTVSDPLWNKKSWVPAQEEAIRNGASEKVWEYGQTGVFMEPMPVVDYLTAFDRSRDIRNLSLRLHPQKNQFVTPEEKKTPLKLEDLQNVAGRLKQALWDAEQPPSAGFTPIPLSDKEREQLKAILARPIFADVLRADSLKPSALKRALTRSELNALGIDVKTMEAVFNAKDQATLAQASEKLGTALDRAVALPLETRESIRQNGMRFIKEQHSEEAVMQRFYVPILEEALKRHSLESVEALPSADDAKSASDAMLDKGLKPASEAKTSPFVIAKKAPLPLEGAGNTPLLVS